MARHRGAVLIDTMVILECWRVGAWKALCGGYRIETVEDCLGETQTGYQRRRDEQRIDARELRKSLAAVHDTSDLDRARAALAAPDIALDRGEQSLWGHALTRTDDWLLCGPDKASLRFGVEAGFRDRLVALEGLLTAAGFRPKLPLARHHTDGWLAATLGELVLSVRQNRRT